MSTHIDYEINKELGECYLFMGDFDKAETYYDKAIAAAPEEADAHLGQATVAVQKGDLDRAAALYAKAAELKPSDRAFAGLGLVSMEQGANDAALEQFQKALECNPVNMVAINGLVQCGHFVSRLDAVVPCLRAALEVEATEPVRYALAGCLAALGRDEEAKKELEILLGVNPANEGAKELYARMAA